MLLMFNQFLLKEAIRSPIYLLNPAVIKQEEISLPRLSIIHYLENAFDNHFPTRDLVYFNNILKNKKIPVFNIVDLISKEETSTLLNKMAGQEVRKWMQENNRDFKNVNLLEIPNQDVNLIAVYNYNILKDLYKYKGSLLSSHYKYQNLYGTYWYYIKEAINKENESYQFVKIELPNVIPNVNVINVLLKFNPIKFARIVNDNRLAQILDLYRWLLETTRQGSTLKNITDEDSKRIIIELSYKGYSSFLPLYVIRSICEESKLENTSKISNAKAQKLLILTLYKIQNKINALLEINEEGEKVVLTDDTPEIRGDQIKHEDDEEHEQDFDITHDSDKMDSFPTPDSIIPGTKVAPLNKNDKVFDDRINSAVDINITNLNQLLDDELSTIDASETDRIFEDSILQLDSETEEQTQSPIVINNDPDHIETILKDKTLQNKFDNYLKEVLEFKLLTSQEIRTLRKTFETRQQLKSPYDPNTTIDNYKQIIPGQTKLTKEDTNLDIDNTLIADDLKKEVVLNLDKKYLTTVLHKDIAACVTNIEKAGVIIKDYTVENNSSILGNYEVHKLTLKPLHGKESTVYFRLPKIDSEGEFTASGIRYRMRKQRTDLPIRKISPTRVALTSNYSKLFVFRTERKSFDSYSHIVDHIKETYIAGDSNIVKIKPGNFYSNLIQLPNMYSNMSMNFDTVETDKYKFLFNYRQMTNYIDEKVIKDLAAKDLVFIGYDKSKNILATDYQDNIFNYSKNMEEMGDLVDLLEMDRTKVPKSFTMINILGDGIPLGVVMAYYLGISNLISVTGVKHQLLESNKQYKPTKNEIVLKFNDYKLIIEPTKPEDFLLFNGFFYFKDVIKQHELKDFDYKEIYLALFEHRNLSLIHIKEINLLEELFLDPITIDVLASMKEPTDFFKLLFRANEMLKDFAYPDINDPKYSRIRGYDRMPGLMYRALSESIRAYKFKGGSKSKIELDPYKVWNYVTQDNTVKITEDNNPITDTKEIEAITFSGMDGLNKDATPMYMRRYHENDIGFVSEATIDSGDVALNTYLTPYARFKDVRGLIDMDNNDHLTNKSKLFSTSVMLSPGSDQDDPKRINFVNIQNGHTIMSEGYQQPLLRTGYEYLMPFKVGKLYCTIAQQDGSVIAKNDKLLTVKYKDGTTESIQLGNRYGRMEGSVYPHELVTRLQTGNKFKKSDYLVYNTGFFEPDWLDPTKLVMKFGRTVTVALMMTNEVFEDSSAISTQLSEDMATTIVKEKSFIIDFNKIITGLVSKGTNVEPNDVLFTVLDENTDYNNLSESTIEMLQNLASLAPKAKVKGVVDKYEIRYNGELSDMSPSLRKLASYLDKELYEESKGTDVENSVGKVSSEYRVSGKNLNLDTLELKVYIRVRLTQAIGDKGVFANQMKSVISDVYTNTIMSEGGERIDAVFSYRGMLNRIVTSPIMIGTTNRLLKHVSKQVADIYFGK